MIFKDSVSKDLFDKLKSKNWYRHGIYRSIMLWTIELAPALSREEFLKEGIDKGMENAVQLEGEFFVAQEEFDEFCALYTAKLSDGINYLRHYIENYSRDMNEALARNKELLNISLAEKTNSELAQLFLKHFADIRPLHHWLWSMEFLNESFDRKIHSLMKEKYPDWSLSQTDSFLGSISYNPKRQFFQQEQEEVLGLEDIDDPKLNQLFELYRWMKLHFMDEHPFTLEEYKVRISEMLANRSSLAAQVEKSKKDVEEAQKLIASIEEGELKEYLKLMNELSYIKTYRIDVYTLCFFYATELRNEIIRRLGITYDDLEHCTVAEIAESLNGAPINREEIKARSTWCVVKVDNEMEQLKGDAVEVVRSAIWKEDVETECILGTVAYKGVVRGKVRISYSSKDIDAVQEGEILVCNLTNPDYNPVFKKIAGIVTDEGGVLCHSAIMAREFKLPCIIGTKVATKVFKDGDLVEVDAEKGIVRIIK